MKKNKYFFIFSITFISLFIINFINTSDKNESDEQKEKNKDSLEMKDYKHTKTGSNAIHC